MALLTTSDQSIAMTITSKAQGDGIKDTNKGLDELDKNTKTNSKSMVALGAAAKAAKVALTAVAAVTAAGTAVGVAAAKASWDQVSAVEQATVGLRAYERNGEAVNAVLKDLISYARSDMGVLFNRKDLFQSAQMLKLNGVETSKLTEYTKILSRSVGLGLGNWQDLNAVVGRVVSTGRLTGIEFDMLTQYGYKLDKSLRNTNLSAAELFKALDKGIPVDAMAGQASTINGLGIRIQTAFRSIGDAILGVDADTSKFVKGGLGDLITTLMGDLPGAIKQVTPTIRELSMGILETARNALPSIIDKVRELGSRVAQYLSPKIAALTRSIERLAPTLKDFANIYILPLARLVGGLFVGSIGLAIDGLNLLVNILKPLVGWLNNNRNAVAGLAGAFATLVIASRIHSMLVTLQAAIMGSRAAMVVATIATQGLRGAFTSLLTAMGPYGIVLGLLATGAGILASQWSKGSFEGERQAQVTKTLADRSRELKVAQDMLRDSQLALQGANLGVERAQRSYDEAVKRYGPTSLEAREAEHNLKLAREQVKKATEELKTKQDELRKSQEMMNSTIKVSLDQYDKLSGRIWNVQGAAYAANVQLKGMNNAVTGRAGSGNVQNAANLGIQGTGRTSGFYTGVRNFRGGLAVVGERGPELVSLPRGSSVYKNSESQSMSKVADRGGDTNIYGDVVLSTAEAVNAMFQIDKNSVLAQKRLTTVK